MKRILLIVASLCLQVLNLSYALDENAAQAKKEQIQKEDSTEAVDPGQVEYYTDFKAFHFQDQKSSEGVHPDSSELRVRLGIRYQKSFSEDWLFDSDVRAIISYRESDLNGSQDNAFIEVKRLYVRRENLFNNPYLSMDVGRKRLKDNRAWLYDTDMDVLGLEYSRTLINFEGGIAGWLWNGRLGSNTSSREEAEIAARENSWYLYAQFDYQWYYKNFIGLSFVKEDYQKDNFDGDDDGFFDSNSLEDFLSSSDMSWLTLKVSGEITSAIATFENPIIYWLDFSTSIGERYYFPIEDQYNEEILKQDIESNYAFDLGFFKNFDHNQYYLGLSYAEASGDDFFNENSSGFFQPLIVTNKKRLSGVKSFHLYGHVLNPQLNNLEIVSLWAGMVVAEHYWIELAYHQYQQKVSSPLIYSSRLVLSPNGESQDIGKALDIIVSSKIRKDLDLQIIMGGFKGGSAFDSIASDKNAYRVTVEVNARW